jgi:hypothetical protein
MVISNRMALSYLMTQSLTVLWNLTAGMGLTHGGADEG